MKILLMLISLLFISCDCEQNKTIDPWYYLENLNIGDVFESENIKNNANGHPSFGVFKEDKDIIIYKFFDRNYSINAVYILIDKNNGYKIYRIVRKR